MSFKLLHDFESCLAQYTGAPYVVVTDCCTHALELCLRYDQVRRTKFTAFTYLSVVQLMRRLAIDFQLTDQRWQGEYALEGTRIWDSARRLEPGMYRAGQMQCLSFGYSKPLQLGRCGAILLDDAQAHAWLRLARSDGRDLTIQPWQQQITFAPGYHYCPTLELCELGIQRMASLEPQCQSVEYPDCRMISIQNHAAT